MSSNLKLSTFPSTKEEALTMLYMETKDLSRLSEEELVERYMQAEESIKKALKDYRRSKHSSETDIF